MTRICYGQFAFRWLLLIILKIIMVCSTLIKIGLDAAIDLLFEKKWSFWATFGATCLEHQYIGGRGWCKWFCTITALKLLLNWGVLESMNFFQKNIISSTTNIEHRQHHTREIDNINHWWCVWFRISAKILIMWWWIWTSVTLACVEERKCGTYVKFLQVSEPKSWPN